MASPPPGFDASHVSPGDAVVTLRSFRRRFAEAFDQAEGDAPLVGPSPGGGPSPHAHAAWTASALGAIGDALDRVMVADDPGVTLPAVDPPGAGPSGDAGETPAATLARLGEVARRVADAMAQIHGDAWSRTGTTASGPMSALDIARLGVQIGVQHLRATEQAIRASQR